GFEEPESVLLLVPAGSKAGSYRTILFVRKRDETMEMWEGERYGTDRAVSVFGADEAYVIEEFDEKLPELLKGSDEVYYRLGRNARWDQRILTGIDKFRRAQGRTGKALAPIRDPNEVLGEQRLYKTDEEVALMRRAGQISALAHKTAMQDVRPGMN